jgi:predicted nucleic acid-binding protein
VPEPLVIDANPIMSALLGGTAREVLFSDKYVLYSPQHTLFEVAKYLPFLARRLDVPELDLLREYQLLPIIACQPDQYDAQIPEATRMIGARDPRDIAVLALTLSLGCPLWTEDRDFDGLARITVQRTADLLAR